MLHRLRPQPRITGATQPGQGGLPLLDHSDENGTATLADIGPGRTVQIVAVDCRTPVGQRMLQLGLLEGTVVDVVRRAPAGDPLEIRLMGYSLSLRSEEARSITVAVCP